MHRFIIFLFFITLHLSVKSQVLDKRLKIRLSKIDASFNMPTGYLEVDSGFYFNCGDYKQTNGVVYTIMKADSSIKIAMGFYTYPSPRELELIRSFTPGWNQEENYLKMAKYLADTVNHPLVFYSKEYLHKVFNADDGGELVRRCVPYQDKYIYNRHVFAAKKGRGFFELNFLYTEKAKATIEEEIKQASKMIRYND